MATSDWAMWYLNRGIAVVPQLPGEKRPTVRWKDFQDRQPSLDEMCDWYRRFPNAGVAAVLGPVSGLFCIDVDGSGAHEVLVEQLGGVPEAPTVISGSHEPNRYHLFFQHPDCTTKAKITPWHPQLEFRGKGGLVVLPPSIHPSGNRYEWAAGRSLTDLEPPQLPEQLLQAVQSDADRRRPRNSYAVNGLVNTPSIPGISWNTEDFLAGWYAAGPRWNDRLFAAACDLAGNGVSLEDAEPLLIAGAQPANCVERENARRTINSAFMQTRLPSRLYADHPAAAEPAGTFQVAGIAVRELTHPGRRQLPANTTLLLRS